MIFVNLFFNYVCHSNSPTLAKWLQKKFYYSQNSNTIKTELTTIRIHNKSYNSQNTPHLQKEGNAFVLCLKIFVQWFKRWLCLWLQPPRLLALANSSHLSHFQNSWKKKHCLWVEHKHGCQMTFLQLSEYCHSCACGQAYCNSRGIMIQAWGYSM